MLVLVLDGAIVEVCVVSELGELLLDTLSSTNRFRALLVTAGTFLSAAMADEVCFWLSSLQDEGEDDDVQYDDELVLDGACQEDDADDDGQEFELAPPSSPEDDPLPLPETRVPLGYSQTCLSKISPIRIIKVRTVK